jgi:hypothetical protein
MKCVVQSCEKPMTMLVVIDPSLMQPVPVWEYNIHRESKTAGGPMMERYVLRACCANFAHSLGMYHHLCRAFPRVVFSVNVACDVVTLMLC